MIRRLLLAGAIAVVLAAPAFADAIKQGGTMTITYKDDFTTLDPAIGYDWQNWSPLKSLFSRLMDYKPGYNIAPTDAHSIVRSRFEDREVVPAKWGLVNFWMTDRKQAFKNISARHVSEYPSAVSIGRGRKPRPHRGAQLTGRSSLAYGRLTKSWRNCKANPKKVVVTRSSTSNPGVSSSNLTAAATPTSSPSNATDRSDPLASLARRDFLRRAEQLGGGCSEWTDGCQRTLVAKRPLAADLLAVADDQRVVFVEQRRVGG